MASGRQHRSVRSETEGSRRVKRAALLFPPETPVCTTNRVTKHDVGDRGRVNRRRAELFAVLSAGCSPVTVSPATRIPYFDIQNLPHRQSLDSRPNPAVQPASGELAVETHLLSERTPGKLRFTVIPSEIQAKIRLNRVLPLTGKLGTRRERPLSVGWVEADVSDAIVMNISAVTAPEWVAFTTKTRV